MGSKEELLKDCFWPCNHNSTERYNTIERFKNPNTHVMPKAPESPDSFKEHGIYVIRFFKDASVIYVVIDDLLPVKKKDGKLVFAYCKDPNELWVPLIEKAYAKVHGCYKALIGGYSHYALGDMTGFCPRLVVLKEGIPGFTRNYPSNEVWEMINKYQSWGCLMGCSIQSDPKAQHKVEHSAGDGLMFGHAYSLLDVQQVDVSSIDTSIVEKDVMKVVDKYKIVDGNKTYLRLVKIRNPWGRGEWEGAFGDNTDERHDKQYKSAIDLKFSKGTAEDFDVIEASTRDGTFFMPFQDFISRFNNFFVAINFPSNGEKGWKGKRCQGSWSGDVGGNRSQGDWFSNPKIKINLKSDSAEKKEIFVGIYIRDSRMTLGYEYNKVQCQSHSSMSKIVITQINVTITSGSSLCMRCGIRHRNRWRAEGNRFQQTKSYPSGRRSSSCLQLWNDTSPIIHFA